MLPGASTLPMRSPGPTDPVLDRAMSVRPVSISGSLGWTFRFPRWAGVADDRLLPRRCGFAGWRWQPVRHWCRPGS